MRFDKRQSEAILRIVFLALFSLVGTNVLAADSSDAFLQNIEKTSQWSHPDTMFHMGGYAAVGYTSSDTGGDFTVGSFSPIFHYLYRDMVMLESELEIEVTEAGETNLEMEYAAIDYFLNDYVTVVGGKFLSPLGQFRQNMHPSWVNKLPEHPAGFGHDQAAPNADVGLQLRGGFPMGTNTANYAVYVANGPALEADVYATPGSIEKIETPGIGADGDGNKVFGGRFGIFLPGPKLDLGVSAASGKASLWDPTAVPVAYKDPHDYTAAGADFIYRPGPIDIRGEYIQQKIGDTGVVSGGTWQAWYLQGAYRPAGSKWEFVARYANYDTPDPVVSENQTAVGVNYLFSSNAMAKLAYQSDDYKDPGTADTSAVMVQMAYGF